jgi:hypothetical protein
MAIEFHCPQCQRLMRTPDATAGKKGKCPGCGAITDIPRSAAPAARESTIAAQPAPQAAPAAPSAPPGTGRRCAGQDRVPVLAVRQAGAHRGFAGGQEGQVSQLRRHLPNPRLAGASGSQTPNRRNRRPALSRQSKPAVKSAPVTKSKPAAAPRPATRSAPGLTPLGASSGLTPLDDVSGLTPLKSTPGLTPRKAAPGLTPLSAAPGLVPLDDAVGLTPLDGLAGLTPLDPVAVGGLTPLNDPLGLTPLAGDPLGGLSPIADPFAGAGLGGLGNPYQSPAAVAKPVVRKKRRSGEFGYVEVLSCTWYTFWDNWSICLLASLLLLVLNFAVGFVFGIVNVLLGLAMRNLPELPNSVRIAVGLVVLAVIVALFVFLVVFVQAGMIRMSVAMVKGKSGGVADVFSGAEYVFPLLGALDPANAHQFRAGFCARLSDGFDHGPWQRNLLIVGLLYFILLAVNLLVAILLLNMQFLIVDQSEGFWMRCPSRPAA